MSSNVNKKRIVKNTIFLYTRMLFMMCVTLYTSRVVLSVLGVDDYGIFHTVCGIVGLLDYVINGPLCVGASRFLSFDLGGCGLNKLRKTFSTLIYTHLGISLVIVVIAETVGLWFLYNRLIIPASRFDVAIIVFHISVLITFLSVTETPFLSSLISNEKMSVYAYVGMFEASSKLLVAYLLLMSDVDKLVLYVILLLAVKTCITAFVIIYCRKKIPESNCIKEFDCSLLKKIIVFSTWNFIGNSATSLLSQGIVVLVNMFFPSKVITSISIANQVSAAARSFVFNFQTASTPQIVKEYSAGNYCSSKMLVLDTAKYSFYLMLIIALPVYCIASQLLYVWLGFIPEQSSCFLKLTIITCLFQVIDASLFTPFSACGDIRSCSLWHFVLSLLAFPIIYILFKLGYSPKVVFWILLIVYFIQAIVVKPILLIGKLRYKWRELKNLYMNCCIVLLVASALTFLFTRLNIFGEQIIISALFTAIIAALSSFFSVWYIGLSYEIRCKIIDVASTKIHNIIYI